MSSKLPDMDVDRIRARCIELVDAHGRPRATFATSAGDTKNPSSTYIQLHGDDGLPKLELQVDGNSPGIRLTAANDCLGFSVSVNETSNGIMIGDSEGRPVVQIGICHNGAQDKPFGSKPALVLSDYDDGTESVEVAIKECKVIQPPKKSK